MDTSNLAKWMEMNHNKIKDKRIRDIILPGTHDSGAYKFSYNRSTGDKRIDTASKISENFPPLKLLLANYTFTQDDSLYQQLKSGIRCLDLRLTTKSVDKGAYQAEYLITHSFFLLPLVNGAQQIMRFLNENKFEVVVVTISRDHTHRDRYNGNAGAIRAIEYATGHDIISAHHNLTYEDAVRDGKRLILLDSFNASWVDTNDAGEKHKFLIEKSNLFSPYQYNIMSFTVTPQKSDYIKFTLLPCKNIQGLSEDIHERAKDYLKGSLPQYTACIMFDFPTKGLIVDVINKN